MYWIKLIRFFQNGLLKIVILRSARRYSRLKKNIFFHLGNEGISWKVQFFTLEFFQVDSSRLFAKVIKACCISSYACYLCAPTASWRTFEHVRSCVPGSLCVLPRQLPALPKSNEINMRNLKWLWLGKWLHCPGSFVDVVKKVNNVGSA